MFLSQVTVGFDKMNEVLGLPADSNIVSVKEKESGDGLILKVVSPREPSDVVIGPQDSLSKIGSAFLPTQAGTRVLASAD